MEKEKEIEDGDIPPLSPHEDGMREKQLGPPSNVSTRPSIGGKDRKGMSNILESRVVRKFWGRFISVL